MDEVYHILYRVTANLLTADRVKGVPHAGKEHSQIIVYLRIYLTKASG